MAKGNEELVGCSILGCGFLIINLTLFAAGVVIIAYYAVRWVIQQ